MSKIRISYGIALCRNNEEKNNSMEILLIKKRFSYHYFSFVMGHYQKNDTKYIRHLLNNMSFSEKIDILGMKFDHMWQRIWLNNPKEHFDISDKFHNYASSAHKYSNIDKYRIFYQKKKKFEINFMSDEGKKLKNMIQQSKDAEIMWEIPKGSKISETEKDIDCAIREFYEETSIESHKYKILYQFDPIVSTVTDNDTMYKTFYFVAVPKKQYIDPKIDYKNFDQISEIEQIRWISIEEIRFMNLNHIYHKKLIEIFNNVKKVYKKYKTFSKTLSCN